MTQVGRLRNLPRRTRDVGAVKQCHAPAALMPVFQADHDAAYAQAVRAASGPTPLSGRVYNDKVATASDVRHVNCFRQTDGIMACPSPARLSLMKWESAMRVGYLIDMDGVL